MLETSGNLEAVYGIRSDVSSRSNHSTRGMLPVRELVWFSHYIGGVEIFLLSTSLLERLINNDDDNFGHAAV
jgi:hypothetical protein